MCPQCAVQMYSLPRLHIFLLGKSCGRHWGLKCKMLKNFIFFLWREVMLTVLAVPQSRTNIWCFSEPLTFLLNLRELKGRSQDWSWLGDINHLIHPALLLCCPAWDRMKPGCFKLSELILGWRWLSPLLQKNGGECFFCSAIVFLILGSVRYRALRSIKIRHPNASLNLFFWLTVPSWGCVRIIPTGWDLSTRVFFHLVCCQGSLRFLFLMLDFPGHGDDCSWIFACCLAAK